MNEYTLESPLVGFECSEKFNESTLPDYILQRVEELSSNSNGTINTHFIVDAVTGDFHDFSTVEEETRKIASALYKRGMRKFDTVIFMTTDMVHLPLLFIGVWRANGMLRATYPEDDFDTLLSRVEESRVGWILCDPQTADMCLAVADRIYWGVEVIVVGEYEGCTSLSTLFEDDGSEIPHFLLKPDDTAFILCTSGTTGRAKGAVHTHRSLLHVVDSISRLFPFSEDKMNLVISKGTHITGAVLPIAALTAGKTVLVLASITKGNLFNAVDRYKPGMIWGFPTFLLALVHDPEAGDYDFSSLDVAVSGGAPVTPAIEHALMTLPNLKCVVNAYGLTEVMPVSCSSNLESGEHENFPNTPPFTIGKLFPGVSVQIRDLSSGVSLGSNQKGEIYVKSKFLFRGYFKNEEATNEAIRDGWFQTGDVGYYDDNGFLFIVDRMKEIFKYYNNHISPTELEDVIAQHPAKHVSLAFQIQTAVTESQGHSSL